MLLPLTTLTYKHNAPLLRHYIATTGLVAISSPAVEAGSATEIQKDDRLSNKAVSSCCREVAPCLSDFT